MQLDTIFDQIFFTTVHITNQHGSVGTGFFYQVPINNDRRMNFIVTNKHVIHDASELKFRLFRKDASGAPNLKQVTTLRMRPFDETHWTGHPDSDVDVAVIPFDGPLNDAITQNEPCHFVALTPEDVPTAANLSELDSVVDVSFVGYPSGLYDMANSLPIVRRGATASHLHVDYEERPIVLIDASIFPGSSGSPVFVIQDGLRNLRNGDMTTAKPIFYFLGVVAAMFERTISGQLESTNPELIDAAAQLRPIMKEGVDLGIVYRSTTVDECVDIELAKTGVTRLVPPVS